MYRFGRVIWAPHDNSGILSFHVYIIFKFKTYNFIVNVVLLFTVYGLPALNVLFLYLQKWKEKTEENSI